MIINTFQYAASRLQVLLVDNFFPDDLLEELLIMCETSETHPDDWEYAEWTNKRKIHKGNTDTYRKLEQTLSDSTFLSELTQWPQSFGRPPLRMQFIECKVWADYPGFGTLNAHTDNTPHIQGQIFLTRNTHKTNGTSMMSPSKELLFTLPYRNNYGWVMQDCRETMHSREFDTVPNTVRYSVIFWHYYEEIPQ